LGKSDNGIESELGLLGENEITMGHPPLQPLGLVTENIHTHRINFHSQFSKNIFVRKFEASSKTQQEHTALNNLILLCIWPHTQRN